MLESIDPFVNKFNQNFNEKQSKYV